MLVRGVVEYDLKLATISSDHRNENLRDKNSKNMIRA